MDKRFDNYDYDEDDRLFDEEEEDFFEEKGYGPSNPWDAPGMCVDDFIKGVQTW